MTPERRETIGRDGILLIPASSLVATVCRCRSKVTSGREPAMWFCSDKPHGGRLVDCLHFDLAEPKSCNSQMIPGVAFGNNQSFGQANDSLQESALIQYSWALRLPFGVTCGLGQGRVFRPRMLRVATPHLPSNLPVRTSPETWQIRRHCQWPIGRRK